MWPGDSPGGPVVKNLPSSAGDVGLISGWGIKSPRQSPSDTAKSWCWCLVAQSCLTLCDSMDCNPPGSFVHGDSPGKNTGMGCYVLLQGIFWTQGLNPGPLHCRWILYHLSHQGSSRILEWVAYPFPRGSSQPRNQTRVSLIASKFFISWATKEDQKTH